MRGAIDRGEERLKTNKQNPSAVSSSLEAFRKYPVIHCKGHHRTDPISKGNGLADQTAKEAVTQPSPQWTQLIFNVLLLLGASISKDTKGRRSIGSK